MKFATIILLAAMTTGCVSKHKTDAYEAPPESGAEVLADILSRIDRLRPKPSPA